LLIFNPNGTSVNVTATWTRLGTTTQLDTATFSIPANSSQYVTSATYPRGYNGVASSLKLVGSQPIVVQGAFSYAAGGKAGYFGNYRAIVDGTGSETIYAPFVSGSWNGSASTGQNTNVLIQNMSGSSNVVTYRYYDSNGSEVLLAGGNTLTLPANGNQYITIASNSEVWTFNGSMRFTGEAGKNIAAVILDSGLGGFLGSAGYPKDTESTYNAIEVAP
jgi:hypothetical protein